MVRAESSRRWRQVRQRQFTVSQRYVRHACVVALALLGGFVGCATSGDLPSRPVAEGGANAAVHLGGNGGGGSESSEPETAGTTTSGPDCLTSADCAPPTPYCALKHCVGCLSNANCGGNPSGRYCNPVTQSCAACLSDGHCSSTMPYCSPLGDCVQCLSTRNCGSDKAACNPVTLTCVAVCFDDKDCVGAPGRPYCNVDTAECVACLTDDECPVVTPRCLPAAGICAECANDDDCPQALSRCDTRGKHVCVECLQKSDCGPLDSCKNFVCSKTPE